MARRLAPNVKVTVTEEIVTDAVRGDSSHCMIAEAVKAAYPMASHVSVDIQTIRFSDPTKRLRYTYLTPRMAQEMLIAFDEGDEEKLGPFQITLKNGQVSAMSGKSQHQRKTSGWEKGLDIARGMTQAKTLRMRGGGESTPGSVQGIDGGSPPPVGPLAHGRDVPKSRRRQYGVRGLDRKSSRLLKHVDRTAKAAPSEDDPT